MNRHISVLTLLALAACGDDPLSPVLHVDCHPLLEAYTELEGDTVSTASGLKYIEVEAGSGNVTNVSSLVDVNYSGYLTSENRFDTSCTLNRTVLRFRVGAGQLIPGFELGVLGMQPGGVRRLIVPPELGYGGTPYGSIPAGSTLIFDIQLVDFP